MARSRSVVFCLVLLTLRAGTVQASEPAAEPPGVVPGQAIRLRSGLVRAGSTDPSELFANGGPALVRLNETLGPATRNALELLGADLVAVVDRRSLLVVLPARSLEQVLALDRVAWVEPYLPPLKLSPPIAAVTPDDPRAILPVTLHLFPRADADVVAARLTRLGASVEGVSQGRPASGGRAMRPGRIVVRGTPGEVVSLRAIAASWPETLWIDRRPAWRLHNDGSPWALQGGLDTNKQQPLYDHGIFGEGQVIGILDTGLDADMCFFRDEERGLPPVHVGLGAGIPDPDQRKVTLVNFLWSGDDPSDDGDWDNQDHGTHVAGSAAGDDLATPGQRDASDGMAPRAKLVVQDGGYAVDDCADLPAIGCPAADLYPFFEQAYLEGVRIHSNSYGDRENFSPLNIYSEGSEAADAFVWDHPDFLLLFSAGNGGPGPGTVASPSTGKNVISVGASGRAGSSRFLTGFSSRGPTDDGRIKPDVTAPGQFVRSANGDADVGSNNCFTKVASGTSMSSPTAAGAAALAREYYERGFYPTGTATPEDGRVASAALLKATLIASAVAMEDVALSPPSNEQGWGRILLDDALFFPDDARRLFVADVGAGFGSALEPADEYGLEVLDASEPLRVVLVWTDYPSTPMAAVHLVNDLDLEVVSPGGATFRGNVFANGFSQPGGIADSTNNVEAVRIDAPQAGTWTVRVAPAAVPQPSQGYALVATGRLPASGVRLDRTASSLDDAVGGNGNGILEPGEWIDLQLALRNTGTLTANDVRVGLDSPTPLVDIVEAEVALGDLPPGQSQTTGPVHLRLRLDPDYPCTQPLSLELSYLAAGSSRSETVEVRTGESVFLREDFEGVTDWHLVEAESDAFRGNWELGDPDLTEYQPGLDVTPGPGTRCLFTDDNPSGDDVGDVQEGQTVARSGAHELSTRPQARVRFHRWFANRDQGEDADDYLRLQIRQGPGWPDVLLEELGTDDHSPAWHAVDFRVSDYVFPNDTVELSVVASDGPAAGNVIEAAIDEVLFWEPACQLYDPAPRAVNDLSVRVQGSDVVLEWTRPALDPGHGSTERYRIYRSTTPSGGFTLLAEPQDAAETVSWADPGAALDPSPGFYEVIATNASGDSDGVP